MDNQPLVDMLKQLDFDVENELTIDAQCGDEGHWTFCNTTDRKPIKHDALTRYCLARYGNEEPRNIELKIAAVSDKINIRSKEFYT